MPDKLHLFYECGMSFVAIKHPWPWITNWTKQTQTVERCTEKKDINISQKNKYYYTTMWLIVCLFFMLRGAAAVLASDNNILHFFLFIYK